jgi:hypothetical protein
VPAPVLIYSIVTRLPVRIATLFVPAENSFASLPVVSPLVDDDGVPMGLAFDDGRGSLRFEQDETEQPA